MNQYFGIITDEFFCYGTADCYLAIDKIKNISMKCNISKEQFSLYCIKIIKKYIELN